jgi:hypothetical protein
MGRDESPRPGNGILLTLLAGAIILVLLLLGYIIVDTINRATSPITSIPNAVGTQVQQIVNPTPTIIADPVTVVLEIRALSRLETASYSIQKVITAESGEGTFGFLFRDKLLLVAQGQVIAGVDLSRMDEGDIQVAGTSVFVTLPASEIFVATLDNDKTYVYDRNTGLLANQNMDLETLARQEAEDQILSAAIEDGILNKAQDNGKAYLESLLHALGFTEVVFVTGTPAPDQDRGVQP